MRLSDRQRNALDAIHLSGEAVVIEDDEMIYLANSRINPFGADAQRRSLISDADVIRKHLELLPDSAVVIYRQARSTHAKAHAIIAADDLRLGNLIEAKRELHAALYEILSPNAKIEIYSIRRTKK